MNVFIVFMTGIALFAASPSPASAEERKQAQDPSVLAFAFADKTGRHLLALESFPDPDSAVKAVCPDGKILTIRFREKKGPTTHNTGRAVASNFDNLGGLYYTITDGRTYENAACLLVSGAFLKDKKVIPYESLKKKPSEPAIITRIEKAKTRTIVHSWGLIRIPEHGEIHLARFERINDAALASLVLLSQSGLVFFDLPGSYKDGNSLWRVDDGGKLTPDQFRISSVLLSNRGIELVVSWFGEEGESLMLLRESGAAFQVLLRSYRYYYAQEQR